MAKRKLKKSVRNTIFISGFVFFAGAFTLNALNENDHAMADTVEPIVETKANELSNVEKFDRNQEISKGYVGGVKAFYLQDEENYSVFIVNETKEKVYVKKSVLKESFADTIIVGDNVKLHEKGLDIEFVSIEVGKSISYKMLTLIDYNDDYTKIVYEDEKTGETFMFDKNFIEVNNLNNYANVGSIATGIVYDGEILSVSFGW